MASAGPYAIICTLLLTNNHASTSSLNFYEPDALPDSYPTASKHWRLAVMIPVSCLTSVNVKQLISCTIVNERGFYCFVIHDSVLPIRKHEWTMTFTSSTPGGVTWVPSWRSTAASCELMRGRVDWQLRAPAGFTLACHTTTSAQWWLNNVKTWRCFITDITTLPTNGQRNLT